MTANIDGSEALLTFGFDIGIASVGWAVLGSDRIVDLGVRCFDRAEQPDTGAPLNEHRRLMRMARTRLARRAGRLKQLRRLLRRIGAIDNSGNSALDWTSVGQRADPSADPWQLRARALDECIGGPEWARALYHIVKRRGFFAARKSETLGPDKDAGRLNQGVQRTEQMLQGRWRTLGEMLARDPAFSGHKRNKAGAYENSLSRDLLGAELRLLFERQRELGNPFASTEVEQSVWDLFWYQKPPLSGDAMLGRIGRCTLEPHEFRAPKRSFSAERFIWLSKLNHIRIVENGTRRALTPAERQAALDLPYRLKRVTYRQLRQAIDLGDASAAGFAGLPYGSKRDKKGEPVDPEGATLVTLDGWHQMKVALSNSGLEDNWRRISVAALEGEPQLMDEIALAVAIHKSDSELRPALARLGLSEEEAEALLVLDYTQFLQLSTLALRRLRPGLEQGLRYDEACAEAGYNHARPETGGPRQKTLPPISPSELRNPVVYRALNQARKVLNELVRSYGSPAAVHIELARDLSHSFNERQDIRRAQEEFQADKRRAVDHFVSVIGRLPRKDELLKMRLYREQDGQCAYSQEPLAPFGDLRQLFDQTEVDHILPYSRSFDDSMNNKVLVLTRENREKGNRTPYEYLGGDPGSERWRRFEAWVRGHAAFRRAKRERPLKASFTDKDADGFKERHLVDTRYATRFFAALVRRHLQFAAPGSPAPGSEPVLCPAGGFTSFLRARWGLLKDREAGDLHHALDACVVAAATRRLQKRVSDFSRLGETTQMRDGRFVDLSTGELLDSDMAALIGSRFPQPWDGFRDEVIARLRPEPRAALGERFPAYGAAELAALKPVFVSRAVRRRPRGAVHADTVRSVKPHLGKERSATRTPLERLTLDRLSNIVGADDARNAGLMTVLRERLEAAGGNGKKAFGPGTPPVHKPLRDGTPGPIIRTVKTETVQKGGVPVRGGVADQSSMWRVDVFERAGKYYLVPIYQADRKKNAPLPDRAVVAHKSRTEWDVVDASFRFCFSLHPNDGVRLVQKGKPAYVGYFAGMDIGSANISIATHDSSRAIGKD
jgi:CRISPR-associated endonuclease Csn1